MSTRIKKDIHVVHGVPTVILVILSHKDKEKQYLHLRLWEFRKFDNLA